jgi:hypothetical protein
MSEASDTLDVVALVELSEQAFNAMARWKGFQRAINFNLMLLPVLSPRTTPSLCVLGYSG